jgi:hypothetical protein
MAADVAGGSSGIGVKVHMSSHVEDFETTVRGTSKS